MFSVLKNEVNNPSELFLNNLFLSAKQKIKSQNTQISEDQLIYKNTECKNT